MCESVVASGKVLHFSEAVHHHADEAANNAVAQEEAYGASSHERGAGPKKQASANGTGNGNHGHVPGFLSDGSVSCN